MSFWTWANPGDQVLVWTVNVIFQVTLVMAVALAVSVIFRRIAAIRYWLLGASLVLVMLSPVIALLMQRGGFGVLSVSLIQEFEPVAAPAPVDVEPEVILPPLAAEASFAGDIRSELPPPKPLFGDERIVPDATPPFDVVPSEPSAPIHDEAVVALEPVAATAGVPVAEASTTNRLGRVLRWTIPPILAIWIIGVVIHLIRLAVGWRRVLSILHSAQPNDDPALQEAFRRVGLALSIRKPPELVLTDAITGPISAGLRRPRVILPTSLVHQIGPEQMHDILLHEVAHIVRRDQAVVLLQNFAAAMYWLHPLMRTLNRHLAQAREEVCDNYVLAATDAPSYSRTLLALARFVQSTPSLPGTVGLFSSRWKLEHRVAGLLDDRRNRTVRTSLRGKLIVAGVAAIMAAVAACGTMTLAVSPVDEAEKEAIESTISTIVETAETVSISGVVLRPDGKPAAGATVRAGVPEMPWQLQGFFDEKVELPLAETVADESGRFTIEIDKTIFGDIKDFAPLLANDWKESFIAASLEGFGPAWAIYDEIDPEAERIELRLVDDIPIRGRVIDLEGRPVKGLTIQTNGLRAPLESDLSAWITKISNGEPSYTVHKDYTTVRNVAPRLVDIPESVTTKDDGTFEIRGVGRERLIEFKASSETVAFQRFYSATRIMETLNPLVDTYSESSEPIFGSDFTFTATPARIVEGIVVDGETREPLANVLIRSRTLSNYPLGSGPVLKATSDASGRFRLTGVPKGGKNTITVFPSDEQPYFMRSLEVPDPPGVEPVSMTVELHRGLWITGHVTDKSTGKPVPHVWLHYYPLESNSFAKTIPDDTALGTFDGDQSRYRTGQNGRYRLVGLPGEAVVKAISWLKPYRPGVGFDAIDASKKDNKGRLLTFRNSGRPSAATVTSVAEINPAEDEDEVSLDLTVDPGASVQLELVDEQNRPVSGAKVDGLGSFLRVSPVEGHVQMAVAFAPDETRKIVIHHEEKNIGRVIQVGPEDIAAGKRTVQLLPCATLTGVLQKNDAALAGVVLDINILPYGSWGKNLPQTTTDVDGRFSTSLIPGCKYNIGAQGRDLGYGIIAEELEIQPGETKDLGVLSFDAEQRKFVSLNPPAAEQPQKPPAAEKKTSATTSETDRKTITGVVLKPDGAPAAGATVRAGFGPFPDLQRFLGVDYKLPISTATADETGRFRIEVDLAPFRGIGPLENQLNDAWGNQYIAAALDGFGPAWLTYKEIDFDAGSIELRLVDDVPIRGRIVDLEGNPVAGLTIEIGELRAVPGEDLSPWLKSVAEGEPWHNSSQTRSMRSIACRLIGVPDTVKTATDGTFEIHGIGRDRLVYLDMFSETVAFHRISVITRKMQPMKMVISSFGNASETGYGAEFTLAVSPARVVEGTVVDAATGKSLPDVTVHSYALANYPISGIIDLEAKSDADGRFRLLGMPKGKGNRMMARPNREQPYFMRTYSLPDPDGLSPISLTVELHRGIWITGRVTDKANGEPVPGVTMHYLPFRDNKFVEALPGFKENGVLGLEQSRYITDQQGNYRLIGLAGRAVIGAHSTLKPYRTGTGFEAIDGPKDAGGKFLTYNNPIPPGPKWPTAMREIDPAADAQEVALDFELDPGASVQLELVDERNQPVSDAEVNGLSAGYLPSAGGPQLTATNFGPVERRTIIVDHKQRNIGRVIEIGPDDVANGKVTVQLLPCATVTGILMNDGDPISSNPIRITILPMQDFSKELPSTSTDAMGRFSLRLIPGCKYAILNEGKDYGTIAKDLEIQPGETKDLGTLTLGDERKFISVDASTNDSPKADEPRKNPDGEERTSSKNIENPALEDLGIGGRVVGPEGKSLNGVTIDVSFPEKVGLRAVARVGDDGAFRIFGDRQFFERAAREFGRYQATITAAKEGLGSDVRLIMLADLPGRTLQLQLQKLIDVQGRIVSAEGQPLPRVEVRIKDISRPATTMEEFIRSAQHDGSTSFEISDKRSFRPNELFRTDADGRFSIPDVPAEHILSLQPRGSGVPFQLIFVASRSAPDSAGKRGTIGEKSFGNTAYYYAKFTHVAPPSRTIRGIVVDQKTGQPVDEINLHCFANGEQLKTGKDGRFEFTRCIKADSYPFSVDTFTRPYFNRGMRIKDTPGLDPLEVKIELLQGTMLRGRVTGITGRIAGEVHYNLLYPSPYSDRMMDGSSRPGYSSAAVNADGTFEIQVLPGPGVVAFRAEHDIEGVNDFLSPWITVDDVKTTLKDGFGAVTKDYSVEGPIDFLQVATRAQGIGQVYLPQYHAATLISIGEDETDVAVELVVEKGKTLGGSVIDVDGQPVSKIQIAWLTEYSRDLQPIAGDQFTIRGISPNRPRSVMFFQEDLHQGAILPITGDEDAMSPITVKLEPCGAIHGRFVDGEGQPLADRLILVYPSSVYPYVYFGPTPWSTRTDKNGEYMIRNLVPGHEYSRYISLEKPNGFLTEKLSKETVKPGETVELGDKVIEILNVE